MTQILQFLVLNCIIYVSKSEWGSSFNNNKTFVHLVGSDSYVSEEDSSSAVSPMTLVNLIIQFTSSVGRMDRRTDEPTKTREEVCSVS